MIPLGLTASEQRAFHRALTDSHDIDVRITLLDLEEHYIGDLSGWLLGGQVIGDMNAEVTRSAQVTILDPGGRSGIDPDMPERAVRHDRMLSISYGVWVDELGRWVRVPVFRGPISRASRDGDVLEVEALGKEHLLRTDGGIVHNYAAGLTRTGVIEDIAKKMGERRMVIPSWAARTSKRSIIVNLGWQSHPWSWMQAAARSMRGQLFYDGSGTLRLRQAPTRTLWWIQESHLMTEPKVTVDDADLVNTVWVKGQPPEGKKEVIEARATLPAWHANSPERLGRNGAKRYLVEEIDDDAIRTKADAEKAAARRVKELMIESFQVECDVLPIPHMDLGDPMHLSWDDTPGVFRLEKFTLGLTADEPMSLGYHRETRRRGKARRVVLK